MRSRSRASISRTAALVVALLGRPLPSLAQGPTPPGGQNPAPPNAQSAAPPPGQSPAAPAGKSPSASDAQDLGPSTPTPPPGPPAPQAGAGFTIVTDQAEPHTAWHHVHSRFPLPKAGGLAGLMGLGGDRWFEAHTVVLPSGRYAARLVDQPSPSLLLAPPISEITRRAKALLGVNGGYFDPEFNAVGLYVLGGVVRRPYRDRQLLSGTVVIGRSGRLEVRTRQAPYQDAVYALQCGPLILDPGGEIGIKNGPGPEARRTVLGVGDAGELAVISTTAVSLRTLAEELHDHPAAFGVSRLERALNLDGGPSTAMAALFTEPPLKIEARTPVRTAVVFFARTLPPLRPAGAPAATPPKTTARPTLP